MVVDQRFFLITIINEIVYAFCGSVNYEKIYQILKINDEKLVLGFQDFSEP